MNEVINNILSRRSCRSYTEQTVQKEALELILKAAIHAPSGMNRQTWQFTVVQGADNIAKLAEVVSKALVKDDYNFYKPNALVLVSNDRDNACGLADCACAMENIFLSAHSIGISSCWINQLKDVCDTPNVRSALDQLGLPNNHIIWGTAALGYAASLPKEISKNESVIVFSGK